PQLGTVARQVAAMGGQLGAFACIHHLKFPLQLTAIASPPPPRSVAADPVSSLGSWELAEALSPTSLHGPDTKGMRQRIALIANGTAPRLSTLRLLAQELDAGLLVQLVYRDGK